MGDRKLKDYSRFIWGGLSDCSWPDSAVGLHRRLPFRPNLGRMAAPSVADRRGPTRSCRSERRLANDSIPTRADAHRSRLPASRRQERPFDLG